MSLSPEMEARGMRAYEQARAFERLRSWRLPASYAFFMALPAAFGLLEWRLGRDEMAMASAGMCVFLLVVSWLHWRRLKLLYAQNIQLLAELEKAHGEALPWVQVEKHLAALDALKRELAGESERRS